MSKERLIDVVRSFLPKLKTKFLLSSESTPWVKMALTHGFEDSFYIKIMERECLEIVKRARKDGKITITLANGTQRQENIGIATITKSRKYYKEICAAIENFILKDDYVFNTLIKNSVARLLRIRGVQLNDSPQLQQQPQSALPPMPPIPQSNDALPPLPPLPQTSFSKTSQIVEEEDEEDLVPNFEDLGFSYETPPPNGPFEVNLGNVEAMNNIVASNRRKRGFSESCNHKETKQMQSIVEEFNKQKNQSVIAPPTRAPPASNHVAPPAPPVRVAPPAPPASNHVAPASNLVAPPAPPASTRVASPTQSSGSARSSLSSVSSYKGEESTESLLGKRKLNENYESFIPEPEAKRSKTTSYDSTHGFLSGLKEDLYKVSKQKDKEDQLCGLQYHRDKLVHHLRLAQGVERKIPKMKSLLQHIDLKIDKIDEELLKKEEEEQKQRESEIDGELQNFFGSNLFDEED